MTPEQWKRLKPIFDGALAQPAESRRAWVQQACGSDAALLHDAEALLNAHDTAGDFLEEPAQLDPADLDTLPEGRTLGAYRIVREIGRGGMGVVYLAHDNLEREVAIKTLPPALAANPQLRERLRREAQAAATINHPAVATVYAFAEIDGHLVIVSEYVRGDTLRTLLSRGAMDSTQAHALAVEIAGALAAAHRARVIHRDLKPENIIVTPAGRIKVVDFGIAHVEAPEQARLTVPGMMLGTPAYMAPEQLAGGVVTPRADVYAFGIVFSEMLTGQHPLAGTGRSASADIGLRRDLPHSGVVLIPPPFDAIIQRCVHTDPNERYASGHELLAALAAEPPPQVVPGFADRTAPGSPRWWWEFHQAVTAVVYWVMAWPAWRAREVIGGSVGRALFIAVLIAVIVAANLRLHLWFTSRFYPAQLRWARRRTGPWIRAADWLFVASLAVSGILVGEDRSPVAVVLIAVAVGAAIAFLVIERATARAAFRTSTTAHA
jgi:hypothetical protein